MFLNNSFNILPWYDSLEKQSSKKWYAFGQSWPLLCPKGAILPFQFVCEALEVTSNIQAVNVNTNEITDLGVAPSVIQGSQPNSTYYVVKLASAAVPALPVGIYYLRFNTSLGYLYSEEITIIDDSSECIKIQYWNEDTLNFASGEINFADNFKFEFYIRSTIGKPEYEFEEELTKRLGYKFIESQTSNKVYKFAFVAPEYICDAMRLIRLCDYVKLTTKFDSYNALSFAYEPKWQDQGDLAAVDVEFDTDCIIQKLESFNRRIKESFYNALLADIDEPVLFSTDTVAQYYTEFTTTSFINGKLIRQLESILPNELQSNFVDLVLPIDNMADDKNTAKKVSLSDLMSLVNSSDISKLFKGHFDADGNLQWIEALSHIGVNGGVTMFIDNGTMSLPQLYAGLPIDGRTLIRDDNGVLMINPDIDLGGGLTEVYWNDIKSKPTFATVATSGKYADLSGLPDLSVYALAKDLAKYVTLNTEQTIAAHKNFLNGLSVGGLGITKSQDDVIYLDANLVVRGGITMYATDTVDVPSIIDSLPTASTSAKGLASFDPNFFSVDDNGNVSFIGSTGITEVNWTDVVGRPTLLSSFINDQGFASTLGELSNIGSWADSAPTQGRLLYQDAGSSEWSYINLSSLSQAAVDMKKLSSWYGVSEDNNMLNRPTTANTIWVDKSLRYYLATSAMTTGKPEADGYILHFSWDNAGWNSQLYIPNSSIRPIQLRTPIADQATTWSEWFSVLDSRGGTINGSLSIQSIKIHDTNVIEALDNKNLWLNYYSSGAVCLCKGGGNVGIGVDNGNKATEKITILNSTKNTNTFVYCKREDTGYGLSFGVGSGGVNRGIWDDYFGKWILYSDTSGVNLTQNVWLGQDGWGNGLYLNRTTSGGGAAVTICSVGKIIGRFGISGSRSFQVSMSSSLTAEDDVLKFQVDASGNGLFYGGITMYSDIRKKTKLQDVELSLKQIADAPLIEHYYNSDSNKTTHVGSIAQYWAGLNDWFCKKDSEGFYTMEIQNAALASAISVARHLQKYETKTDRKIRLLKQRVKELEDKIEKLENN